MANFFQGMPERYDRISNLRPEQDTLYNQYVNSMQGAPNTLQNYYQGMMSGEQDAAFERPLQRQFQEQIMPGIAEQYAGMGSGGSLGSSGFQAQGRQAATDLAERLGSIRANLRQQGAQGLQGLLGGALQPQDQLVHRQREPSLFESAMTGLGQKGLTAAGGAVFGPAGAAAGEYLGDKVKSFLT